MDKTLVGTEESAGAVTWGCSVDKVFLKNCGKFTGVSFMKFKALRSATLLKMTLAKMFWEVLKNTYLRTVATESVKY